MDRVHTDRQPAESLGLYVHVPFCKQRCSYCDFYFVTNHTHVESYVEAVCSEISLRAQVQTTPRRASTIYFGGGTPSRLTVVQLERIVATLQNHFDTSGVREMTIEINPEDASPAYLEDLRQAGFTRLSIGIQSLESSQLKFMHRSHTEEEARTVVADARCAGFKSLSVDLIFGLPNMTDSEWRRNLAFAHQSGADHLSLYGLTIEPKTLLSKWVMKGQVIPGPEEDAERQFHMAYQILEQEGFDHYEISSYGKPGHHSAHNAAYWDHSDYLGFGPAAHSFLNAAPPVRWENVPNLRRYLQELRDGSLPVSTSTILTEDDMMREYVLLSLRKTVGIDVDRLNAQYGHSISSVGDQIIGKLVDNGLARNDGRNVGLTLSGQLVADAVTGLLLNSGAINPIS